MDLAVAIYFFVGATVQFFCELHRQPPAPQTTAPLPYRAQAWRLVAWPMFYPYDITKKKG